MSEHPQQPNPAETPPVWGRPTAPQTPIVVDADGSSAVPMADPAVADAPLAGPDGAPARAGGRRMSTMAKTLTAVGVAAVIAVGGTIAVTSANASNSTAGQAGAGPTGGTGQGGFGAPGGSGTTGTGGTADGRMGGGFAAMSVIGGALHGEFVVAQGTGTVTERIQTGAVTAVSSTSISVKSTDGYAATYAVGSGVDVTAFAAGTDVTVIGTVDGSTVTATSVTAARTFGAVPGGGGSGSAGTAGSAGSVGSGQPTI